MNYAKDIEHQTRINNNYRLAVYTDDHIQLVLMAIKPRDEIGGEIHHNTTQFFRIEQGEGIVIIGRKPIRIRAGFAFIVPPGTFHNVINTSYDTQLKLYTIYSPPEHPANTIQKNKPSISRAEN